MWSLCAEANDRGVDVLSLPLPLPPPPLPPRLPAAAASSSACRRLMLGGRWSAAAARAGATERAVKLGRKAAGVELAILARLRPLAVLPGASGGAGANGDEKNGRRAGAAGGGGGGRAAAASLGLCCGLVLLPPDQRFHHAPPPPPADAAAASAAPGSRDGELTALCALPIDELPCGLPGASELPFAFRAAAAPRRARRMREMLPSRPCSRWPSAEEVGDEGLAPPRGDPNVSSPPAPARPPRYAPTAAAAASRLRSAPDFLNPARRGGVPGADERGVPGGVAEAAMSSADSLNDMTDAPRDEPVLAGPPPGAPELAALPAARGRVRMRPGDGSGAAAAAAAAHAAAAAVAGAGEGGGGARPLPLGSGEGAPRGVGALCMLGKLSPLPAV